MIRVYAMNSIHIATQTSLSLVKVYAIPLNVKTPNHMTNILIALKNLIDIEKVITPKKSATAYNDAFV